MDLARGLEDQKEWSSFHRDSLQMRKSKKIALSVKKWFSFEKMRTGCDIFNSILMYSLLLIFHFTFFDIMSRTSLQNISEVIPTFPYWKPLGLLISDSFL